MTRLIDRGIERGEFKPTPLARLSAAALRARSLTAIIWRGLFERHRHLDTDGLLRTNIELLIDAIRAPRVTPQSEGSGAMKRHRWLLLAVLGVVGDRCRPVHAAGQQGVEFPGYMEADLVLVGSEQGGRVATLAVEEGDTSSRAIPIFTLESSEQEA